MTRNQQPALATIHNNNSLARAPQPPPVAAGQAGAKGVGGREQGRGVRGVRGREQGADAPPANVGLSSYLTSTTCTTCVTMTTCVSTTVSTTVPGRSVTSPVPRFETRSRETRWTSLTYSCSSASTCRPLLRRWAWMWLPYRVWTTMSFFASSSATAANPIPSTVNLDV